MLTTFIAHEQSLADEATVNGGSGRALPGMDADQQHGGKDPAKSTLGKRGLPKTPCPICKKMHWKNKCFQNINADEDAKKLAVRIAPKSPAALAYLKQHPELAPEADAANKDKRDNNHGAGLAAVPAELSEDIVAAAIDNPNPQTIVVGHGKLAVTSDYYSDDDVLESNTYSSMSSKSYAMNPIQGTQIPMPTMRNVKRSNVNISGLNYEADHPHQLHLSVM